MRYGRALLAAWWEGLRHLVLVAIDRVETCDHQWSDVLWSDTEHERYRACSKAGCGLQVWGQDVDDPPSRGWARRDPAGHSELGHGRGGPMSYEEREAIRSRMLDTLRQAQRHRDERPEIVDTPSGTVPAWFLYERREMLAAVNVVREERVLPPIELDAIERVERWAAGHVDYSAKFALYCAELAAGMEVRR